MPIGFAPDETCNVYLEHTMDMPEATRPTFLCRFRTKKESRQLRRLGEQWADALKGEEAQSDEAERKFFTFCYSGSRNTEKPWPDCMDDMTEESINELMSKAYSVPRLAEQDKKKSQSSPASAAASSAAAAPASA